ncbi:MAG: LEVG family PEP-CTERM protein [Jaaginema sp. PMC 1079.18]|nr:LEVG family PEP-CTERM protein [Jaaginema sp. PMC 1080.18]MEC4853355.1 LEVG family PEP-CTERM protein [Jaaginema sp. PMC 1079.18]MEC4868519.1 LEVG family PEP-CTERM protein [Jaaginema sp. PMC 1078.18]
MKTQVITALLATTVTTLTLGAIAPSAFAISFVPQEEGEIDVGLGCLNTCITLDPIIENIVSLTDSTTGSKSRLFVDNFSTNNDYGNGLVKFFTTDAGTNHQGFWFRPSEVTEENGQLEVGTFEITFSNILSELTLDFFDTESWNTTGVLAINGVNLANPNFVASGSNGNIVSQTFTDVKSIVLKLGKDYASGTGDGVNFKLAGEPAAVPEPASLLGLLAVGAFGATKLRKKS